MVNWRKHPRLAAFLCRMFGHKEKPRYDRTYYTLRNVRTDVVRERLVCLRCEEKLTPWLTIEEHETQLTTK